MKLYSLILLVGLINLTYAQDSSKSCVETKHGLQFQIGSLLYLTNFDNYTFSYRYRLNIHSGLRIGLLTNFDKQDEDVTERADTIIVKPPEYHHYYYFKFSVQYLHSIMSFKSFSLILGGGPFISFSKSDRSSEYINTPYIYMIKNYEKTTGYGLDFILGAEYHLAENILISGEYNLTAAYESSDIDDSYNYIYPDPTQNHIDSTKGKRHDFSLGGSGVNLGLSVFF